MYVFVSSYQPPTAYLSHFYLCAPPSFCPPIPCHLQFQNTFTVLLFLIFGSLDSLPSLLSQNTVTMPGQIKSLLGTMRRKPARAPDGKSDAQAAATPTVEKTSVIHDLTHLDFKNAKTVTEAITTIASGEPLDDKEVRNHLPLSPYLLFCANWRYFRQFDI